MAQVKMVRVRMPGGKRRDTMLINESDHRHEEHGPVVDLDGHPLDAPKETPSEPKDKERAPKDSGTPPPSSEPAAPVPTSDNAASNGTPDEPKPKRIKIKKAKGSAPAA